MRSSTWRGIMLLSLVFVLVSGALDAQAARRSSLAGNQFINDADDMFAFPQLTMKYANRVIIDMASSSNGNGSLVFGDNSVWNFNTGRGDFLDNTAAWTWGGGDRFSTGINNFVNGLPGNNGSNGNTMEWWDLGFATNLGDTPFGVNVSWAKDNNKYTPAGADPTLDTSSGMFSLQAGVTLSTVELAGEFGMGSYKNETPGLDPQDQFDYDFTNFSLLARGNVDDFGGQNWRWIAAFASGTNKSQMADAENLSTTGFRGAFGPVWGEPGKWEVAAYMNFDYVKHDSEGNGVDRKDTDKFFNFPAYNFAMEYYINSWFVARGGVSSVNSSATYTEQEAAPDTGEDEGNYRIYDFNWTMGLGVDKGNWGLDLALEEDDVHSGYLPLNGDVSDDPIAYMTAWLSW